MLSGLPCGSVVKNLSVNAGDVNLIPASGRSPGEGNGCPLLYSCLENPRDRGVSRWSRKKSGDLVTKQQQCA